jgi:hypothetical protein
MRKTWLVVFVLVILFSGAGCAKQPANESGFNFIFKYGVAGTDTLDTYRDTFTKDMVMDPAVTVNLTLTAGEMDTIHQKMLEIDFFSYPDKFSVDVPEGEPKAELAPYPTYFFRVQDGGRTKELLWHDKYANTDIPGGKLLELIKLITNIIESREEYKKLPEPKSGYL